MTQQVVLYQPKLHVHRFGIILQENTLFTCSDWQD